MARIDRILEEVKQLEAELDFSRAAREKKLRQSRAKKKRPARLPRRRKPKS